MSQDFDGARCVVVMRRPPRYDLDLVARSAHRVIKGLGLHEDHFDGTGKGRVKPLRYLTVIDGEANGPTEADAKPRGTFIAGTNLVATELMDFNGRIEAK